MREEFGKDYSVYHSILSAIALGKRSRNEIEQAARSSVGGYLHKLEELYRLIKRDKPIFGKVSKAGIQRYYLADNFYEFWFRFISRYQALREINRKERAFENIWASLPDYEGYKFESLIKRIFIEINPFDLEFTRIGRYWDRKGENEIDLVLLDEDTAAAYAVEAKRSLARSLKKEEKIKFYSKVAAIRDLADYKVSYYFAGIDKEDIVIIGENNEKFAL